MSEKRIKGTGWGRGLPRGEDGYGWFPYAYVERDLAVDSCLLVRAEFADKDLFA